MAGVIFTEKAFERTADAVRWVEGERGRRPGGPIGGGLEPTFVRVTSSSSDGNGNHPGVVTVRDHSGDWQDYSAVKVKPLNGESLTSGTRYGCRGVGFAPGGEELYTPLLTAVGGTLTVDRVSGSPTYTCSTLRFDEADGVSISQPAAGVVRVDLAAASYFNVGIVDTGSQGFGGRKIYYDGIEAKADYTSNAHATFGYYSPYNWFGAVFHGAGDSVSGVVPGSTGVALQVKSAGGNTGIIGITPHTATISTTDSLGSISANTTLIVHGYYAVVPVGGSQQTGQDGTVLSGSTASGGIITALGNGNTDYGTW